MQRYYEFSYYTDILTTFSKKNKKGMIIEKGGTSLHHPDPEIKMTFIKVL